ncbi:unannotated protein [freshwater metagenome]|uniref:Unannotated protein n=1 Tax=freshwater metagenome TaxID=449393 RepID=A0A6J6UKR0_9ZZZZ
MTDPLQDSVTRFARGDAARAARLRDNLRTILDRTTDPHLRAIIQRTLDGSMSVRELARDPQFEQELDQGMSRFARWWEHLSPEQREQVVREGREQEAARREALGLPPPQEPPPVLGRTPLLRVDPDDHPDDDAGSGHGTAPGAR